MRPASVLNVTCIPASTKCFQGIATSVVSKSLSVSGTLPCLAIASCPPVAHSTGRCFLTEYRLTRHHKYTTLDFRRAHPRRGRGWCFHGEVFQERGQRGAGERKDTCPPDRVPARGPASTPAAPASTTTTGRGA